MAKDWNYAQMTKTASKAGGPEAWISIIKNAAYNRGASDMKNTLVVPVLLTGIGLGTASVICYQKIKKWISEKKDAELFTEKEAIQAEEFLKKELDTAIEEMRTSESTNNIELSNNS